MALLTILQATATLAGQITGVRAAYSLPKEDIGDNFTHVSFPSAGTIDSTTSSGQQITTHTIYMRLFSDRTGPNIDQALSDLVPFQQLYLNKFNANIKLLNSCDEAEIKNYRIGPYTYAGVNYVVLEFEMEVVEKPAVTYAV